MSLIVAMVGCLLALYMLARLYDLGVCIECGGRGAHRPGCRRKKD